MLRHTAIATALAAALSPAFATTVFDAGAYTVTYDETTTFGFISANGSGSGGAVSFQWNFSPAVMALSSSSAVDVQSYALPSFTIAAAAGYTLSGPFGGLVGNLVFNEFQTGATLAGLIGTVTLDGSPGIGVGSLLSRTVTSTAGPFTGGYYSVSGTVPLGNFGTLGFSDGQLILAATGGESGFASILAQPQNRLEVSFVAAPVPEPAPAALLLAGLAGIGWVARRRARG